MDVFLTVQRKTTTIFLDAREDQTVHEVKQMIEGITKVAPDDQQLYSIDNYIMDDSKTLAEYGISQITAKPQSPYLVKLVFRKENGSFEQPEIVSYSTPPDLPYVMRPEPAAD